MKPFVSHINIYTHTGARKIKRVAKYGMHLYNYNEVLLCYLGRRSRPGAETIAAKSDGGMKSPAWLSWEE